MPKAKVVKEETPKDTSKKTKVTKIAKVAKEVVETKVKTAVVKEVKEVKEVIEAKEIKETKKEVNVAKISPEQLFEVGAHFGHVVKKWNPKMKRYIWGQKNGVHVFDLEKTSALIEEAAKALGELSAQGKRIVFVGTKRQAKSIILEVAEKEGVLHLTQRWMGGLLTNWRQVKLSIDRLNSLKAKRDKGELKKFTKKEQVLFDREIQKLERVLGGISILKEPPEVLVVIDTHKERLAVREARLKGIKVIGLVDTNADPDMVDYPIPMNDDSVKAVEMVIRVLVNAMKEAKK